MLRYQGGNVARRGIYWEVGKGRTVEMAGRGVLTGDASSTFVRIPATLMALAAPVIGLLYVLLMPFAWMAALLVIIVKTVAVGLARMTARSLSFGWRPIEAYLAGRRKKSGPG